MSINEQIEAAWKEQCEDFSKASEHRMFEMGYRAALRGLFKEVDPSEMVVGRYYWVAGMIGEMQGFKPIIGNDGMARMWPIVNGEHVCANIFVVRGPVPTTSEFPIVEVFR